MVDNQFTGSAALADLVLPDTTTAERWDLAPSEYAGDMAYLIMCEKAIDPLFDSRPAFEMVTEIAKRLGVEKNYRGPRPGGLGPPPPRDQERAGGAEHALVRRTAHGGRPPLSQPRGADGGAEGLPRRSGGQATRHALGQDRIFSSSWWEMAKTWVSRQGRGDKITALPEYVRDLGGRRGGAAARAKYPIQLIGHHFKQRTSPTATTPTCRRRTRRCCG